MTRIPFVDLETQRDRIRPQLDRNIARVLDHGQFIMGPEVRELEAELARLCGARRCVGVSSGTDALVVAMMAMGVGPGDAVFVPAFTFTATAEVIALLGATPVFVDVGARSFNIDPTDLERQIAHVQETSDLRPRLVIAVDLFGLAADYDAVAAICQPAGVEILADAAQSFGARYRGRPVGTLARATTTSFFPAKPLGCYGDGGAVFTDDDELAARMESIRLHGKGAAKYDIARIGLNARLDTLQAAILLAKLEIFEDELATRRAIAERYTSRLSNLVEVPVVPDDDRSAWAQYTIASDRRERIKNALADQGFPSAVYYPRPMHKQPAYAPLARGTGRYPVSEALCGRVLSLPMSPYLDPAAQDEISDIVAGAA